MSPIIFKLGFRNLFKNKISTAINIVGFSIGMAACLFIFLFLKFETNFDMFHSNKENLYRVIGSITTNNETSKSGLIWFPIAKDMKEEIPGIHSFCRVSDNNSVKCIVKNQIGEIENLRYADSNFFQFFSFKLINGNPDDVLNSAEKIVLTEKKAKQLFGDEDPIGKSIIFNHQSFIVSGVASNPPSNTHLNFSAIVSAKFIEQSELFYKGYNGGMTVLSYLELAENVTPSQIENALPDFFNNKLNKDWKDIGWTYSSELQNIEEIHLSDGTIAYDVQSNRSKKSLYIIVLINVLILALAMVNYILLYTAQKITKTKNIEILKIFGANKKNLITQTFIEVLILTIIASLLGLFLLMIGSPFLNTYFETSINMEKNIFTGLSFLVLSILVLSSLVTYFSLRRFNYSGTFQPIKHWNTNNSSQKFKGNILVVFQFTVVITLFISFFIISRQNNYLLNAELGFDKENILTINVDEEFIHNELFEFKEEIGQLAEIKSVSLSSQVVGNGITMNGYTIGEEKDITMINVLYTDADFLDCFKVNLLNGRNFKKNYNLDKNAILINETLAKRTGWENPIGKEIDRDGKLKVIGVLEDFHFASLENAVQPMLMMSNPNWDGWGYSVVNIRFQTVNIQDLLAQINKLWNNRFPEIPFEISFLDDQLASSYKSITAQQKISSFFSFIGILIAVIGLLGLTIFTSRTRVKEIGIRKINGATIMDILLLLNKNFVKLVGIAFVMAMSISWYIMHKWLEGFAYKTTMSWWIFALAGVLALTIAILTISWQSLKAAMSNPIETLKDE